MSTRAVLVTGVIRSGTTLIGRILAAAKNGFYVHEPFNPDSLWNSAFPLPMQYFYIDENNASAYANRYAALLRLEPIVRGQWQKDCRDECYRQIEQHSALNTNVVPVIKDPIALFSAEWLVRRFHLRPLIVIRDPVDVLTSLVRLNWAARVNLTWLDCQPRLGIRLQQMADELGVRLCCGVMPTEHALFLPTQAMRFWYIACLYLSKIAGYATVSYERLTRDPVGVIPSIFHSTGLEQSAHSRRIMVGRNAVFDYAKTHQDTTTPVDAEEIRRGRREREGILVDAALIGAVFEDLWSGFSADVED